MNHFKDYKTTDFVSETVLVGVTLVTAEVMVMVLLTALLCHKFWLCFGNIISDQLPKQCLIVS